MADWAFSGEEAIEKYHGRTQNPDLIIMDHRLPGMNGVRTIRQIIEMAFSIAEFIRIVEKNTTSRPNQP